MRTTLLIALLLAASCGSSPTAPGHPIDHATLSIVLMAGSIPLAGAEVQLLRPGYEMPLPTDIHRTDSTGGTSWDVSVPATYSVTIPARHHVTTGTITDDAGWLVTFPQ